MFVALIRLGCGSCIPADVTSTIYVDDDSIREQSICRRPVSVSSAAVPSSTCNRGPAFQKNNVPSLLISRRLFAFIQWHPLFARLPLVISLARHGWPSRIPHSHNAIFKLASDPE